MTRRLSRRRFRRAADDSDDLRIYSPQLCEMIVADEARSEGAHPYARVVLHALPPS